MGTITQQPVNIYLESNPNPNSMKFVTDFMLVPQGENMDFPNINEAKEAPLAKAIFEKFNYVDRVFYMSNFVTVTKNDATDWAEVQHELKHFIKEELEKGTPLLTDDYVKAKKQEEQSKPYEGQVSEIDEKIKFVLDEYVKPAVEQDGGAILFESFNDGVVKVQLQGSCSGCPSSTITLKAGIENLLKRMVPEVKAVEAEGV